MGTFVGHLAPGILLVVLGVWHIFRAISNYTRSPRDHVARAWHPVAKPSSRFKNLELYLLAAFFPIAIIYELVAASTNFSSLVKIGAPIYKILDFQNAVVLLGFWVVALVALAIEKSSPNHHEYSFLLASIMFGLETMTLARQNVGLEGRCKSIQAAMAIACAASSGFLAWNSKAFFAELILSGGIMIQGSWLVQTGFSLYVDAFIPEGCHKLLDLPKGIDGSTQCDIEDARVRARAMMDLAFTWHVVASVVLVAIVFGIVSKVHGHRRVYDPLSAADDLEASSNGGNVALKPIVKQAQF